MRPRLTLLLVVTLLCSTPSFRAWAAIRHVERTYQVTLEEALALHITPKVLEPPVVGFAYQLVSYVAIRKGPAFATQGGALFLRTAGGTIAYGVLGSPNWLTKTDGDPTKFSYVGLGSYVGGAADGPLHYGSKGVELAISGPLTGTGEQPGGPLILVIEWRLMPTYPENT